jgi:hypothetical protein
VQRCDTRKCSALLNFRLTIRPHGLADFRKIRWPESAHPMKPCVARLLTDRGIDIMIALPARRRARGITTSLAALPQIVRITLRGGALMLCAREYRSMRPCVHSGAPPLHAYVSAFALDTCIYNAIAQHADTIGSIAPCRSLSVATYYRNCCSPGRRRRRPAHRNAAQGRYAIAYGMSRRLSDPHYG